MALAAAVTLLAAAATDAADITYTINHAVTGPNLSNGVGTGSVFGQIVTDGTIGTLAQANIVSWNFLLTGQKGATFSISSATASSFIFGAGLSATPTQLLFNFGSPGAIALFEQGLFGGSHYYCLAATGGACAQGESVVPTANTSADAIYAPMSGIVGIAGPAGPSPGSLMDSVGKLVDSRTGQIIGNDQRNQQLLGGNEQKNCSDCGGANAGIGSLSLSAHGRVSLTPELTALGGIDFGHYQSHEALVKFTAGLSGALQYDPSGRGHSRPYGEIGTSVAMQDTRYDRAYFDGTGTSVGLGSAKNYNVSVFGEAGWVDRITPAQEAAAFLRYEHDWQMVGGYVEHAGSGNPFPAAVPAGTDTMDVASLGAQYTAVLNSTFEAGINGTVNWTIAAQSGVNAKVGSFNVAVNAPKFIYYEIGGRLGIRAMSHLTIDLTVNSVLAPSAIGNKVHEGIGLRWSF